MKENKIEDRCYTVYMHTSPSEKKYIGITKRKPEKRWSNGNGYKDNPYFWNAICRHGWDNIKHEILYTNFTEEEAKQKEIELIAYYKSDVREFGYNIDHGGRCAGTMSQETKDKLSKFRTGMTGEKSGFYGKKHTEDAKLRMSVLRKGIKLSKEHKKRIADAGKISILQYTKSMEFIRRWDSAIEASVVIGVSASIIAACCREKEQSAGGFVWRYEFPELIKHPKGHTNPETYNPVDQYCISGEFIKTYNNIEDASLITGIDRSTISKCCKNKQRKSGGFIWRYHGEKLTQEHIEWCNSTGKENVRKAIIQYSISGEFIKMWESTNAITKEMRYNNSAIIRCCKGDQKTSYGFIWRYASDIQDPTAPLFPTSTPSSSLSEAV